MKEILSKKGRQRGPLPVLPLRAKVFFPDMVETLPVGREKSICALKEALRQDGEIILLSQRKAKVLDPVKEDLFQVGTVGEVVHLLHMDSGARALVQGHKRVRVKTLKLIDGFLQADVAELEETPAGEEIDAMVRALQGAFEAYVRLDPRVDPSLASAVRGIDEAGRLADAVTARLEVLKVEDRQALLEELDVRVRIERLHELLQSEIAVLQETRRIRARVRREIHRAHPTDSPPPVPREPERDEFKNELAELEERIRSKPLSNEAHVRMGKELRKLRMMSPMSAEATVVRNYVDWVLALPWDDKTDVKVDIDEARDILDQDHYGLDKVKERILEYLAVQALVRRLRGPILCFVGPPGVGKTSLAKSIARATGRQFVRLCLGGVRDEAEIRGHRRTYIGAMPGKILQSLRKASANNPVFLLDEVDKMSSDFRGDPSSALLEVLDPEQNAAFGDHYLDLDYDLSDVMFIATANTLDSIPAPLLDRMEVIRLAGYTEFEKLQIGRRYLVPKQVETNGLYGYNVAFTDSSLKTLIQHYTKESGVRNLEREIASVCRKLARQAVRKGKKLHVRVSSRNVPRFLGEHKVRSKRKDKRPQIGSTMGLAVTMAGGDLLATEVSVMPGKGKLILTGQVGGVMQESAQAAMSYVRSRAEQLGLKPDFHQRIDIHVHFPEAAIPKDGPSAGITMATSLVSALLHVPVPNDIAMTGEITLRGHVLPVGGVKEKILAAIRAGLSRVIIPAENQSDLRDIPKSVLRSIKVVGVEAMDEVLRQALPPDATDRIGDDLDEPVDYRSATLMVEAPIEASPPDDR